jgi:RNA polymerase sigma-70 factor (ECF subfamily)
VDPTDIELMLRVRKGEVSAFRLLARRYREPLRRFFVGLLEDRSQAEDFVQETLLRLWLSRERYEPSGKFSTYLFQIGKHYWLNQRKKYRPVVSPDPPDRGQLAEPLRSSQPEAVLLEQFRSARIRRAIEALPEHYRVVFRLCHFDGLRYAEISARLGIPVGTVKSRMAEAVRRLRRELAGETSGG